MSYCRFGWDGSDVYVYESCSGGWECCGCIMNGNWNYSTRQEIVDHLLEHRKQGHTVPQYAIDRLREEIKTPQ